MPINDLQKPRDQQELINLDLAHLTIEQFLNRISSRIFGHTASGEENRLYCLGYYKGDVRPASPLSERFQAHMFIGGGVQDHIDLTDLDDVRKLKEMLIEEWGRLKWAMPGVSLRVLADRDHRYCESTEAARQHWCDFVKQRLDVGQLERVIRIVPT